MAAATVQGVWYALLIGNSPYNAGRLSVVAVTGVILYLGIVWITQKQRILNILHGVERDI